jgi:hypothetical protein
MLWAGQMSIFGGLINPSLDHNILLANTMSIHLQEGGSMTDSGQMQDSIREIERQRLRALVTGNLAAADRLHADDFQLITPSGRLLTKQDYLGGIESGHLNYRLWEVDSEIEVRIYEGVALIRYRSQLHMSLDGGEGEQRPFWHTDSYEWRDGRWQVVWSQATEIS